MSHVVQCPQCGSQYRAEDHQIGTQLQCTNCNSVFEAGAASADVPGGAAAPPPMMPQVTPVPVRYAPPTGRTGKATASMVLGIIAIPTCAFYGIPSLVCGIIAVIFGSQARRAIKHNEMSPSAGGMAKAGLICGWIGIVLSVVYWALLVVAFYVMANFAP